MPKIYPEIVLPTVVFVLVGYNLHTSYNRGLLDSFCAGGGSAATALFIVVGLMKAFKWFNAWIEHTAEALDEEERTRLRELANPALNVRTPRDIGTAERPTPQRASTADKTKVGTTKAAKPKKPRKPRAKKVKPTKFSLMTEDED